MIAMVSVGALAIGYLLMSVFSTSSNVAGDVCSTLFGSTSIMTLSRLDVVVCLCVSLVVLILYILLYNRLFTVTFDESFAKATGIKAESYNMLTAIVVAVIIVLAMNLVGSLLISALVIFPALSAMRVFKSFRSVVVCSAVTSVLCAVFGILISLLAETPIGPTIVTANIVVFILFFVFSKLKK